MYVYIYICVCVCVCVFFIFGKTKASLDGKWTYLWQSSPLLRCTHTVCPWRHSIGSLLRVTGCFCWFLWDSCHTYFSMDFAQLFLLELLTSWEILGQKSGEYLLGEWVIYLWTNKLRLLNIMIIKTTEPQCTPLSMTLLQIWKETLDINTRAD